MKTITLAEIAQLARSVNAEPAALMAVIKVEGSGNGFDLITGKILIQFEPFHFQRYTQKRISNGVESQSKEWKAFNEAWKINQEATLLSTSWGMMQVMGFNHKEAGYHNVHSMVDDFKRSEYIQVKGALSFIASNPAMLKALQIKDWATFARGYNGKLFKKFAYDIRLKAAYQQSKGLFIS